MQILNNSLKVSNRQNTNKANILRGLVLFDIKRDSEICEQLCVFIGFVQRNNSLMPHASCLLTNSASFS